MPCSELIAYPDGGYLAAGLVMPRLTALISRLVLALAMVVGTAAGVGAATATWDASTDPGVAGYKLSYGTQSGAHTVVLDVGKVTTCQFHPPAGRRYYVVVQAYNAAGQLSDKSAEVVIDVPLTTMPPTPGVSVLQPVTPTQPMRASETDADNVQDYIDVSGDFDGDGRNDLATYRKSSSEWRIWTSGSNFTTPTLMVWGMVGDRPVAADYNGDRVTDFAVYRPSTGTWHLSLSGTQTPLALKWGGAEDVPVPLDHDGDGKADLALIRGGGYDILLSSSNYLRSVRVF